MRGRLGFFALWLAGGFAVIQVGLANPAWAATGTLKQFTYSGPAGSRPYYVYTPAGYTPATRVPLVVVLHGCTMSASDIAALTRMDDLADLKHFIVVYPQQTLAGNPRRCWNWYLPTHQSRGSGEPAIIAGITQTVMADSAHWNIDPTRVYAAGFSAGAAMTVILGATYPDLYAAIGEGSGLEYAAASNLASSQTAMLLGGPDPNSQGQAAFRAMGTHARVVPVIVFHGTNDNVVYPINGDQVVEQWMATDHLASANAYNASFSTPSTISHGKMPGLQGQAYTVRTWNDRSGREVQEYWTVIGMYHQWSGGTDDPNGPSASDTMYAFFLAHAG
jgi:poly(hydroxyalkanoate) depolymerase family esterase